MKKFPIIMILFFLLVSIHALAAQTDQKILPPQYQKWLNEDVVYIISPVEKDVFLQLDSDRERDLFIEAFWKHRDPVPVTDRNEFREEHYRRIEYANRNLGRLSSAQGWKTDMGRIYITLGPPISIQRFEDLSFAYPVVVWSYQGMAKYGLPDQFNVVFYRRYGLGDYRIYSPIMDGPQSLLAMVGVDQSDPNAAYQALFTQSPDLAQFVLTLIPGEPVSAGLPSLESEQLLLNIAEAQQRLCAKSSPFQEHGRSGVFGQLHWQ
jgi:GWxTD domain-containing protein